MTVPVIPVEPVVNQGHDHPTPRWLRFAFILFGLGMAAMIIGAYALYTANVKANARTVASVAAELNKRTKDNAAELDRRTKYLADALNTQTQVKNTQLAQQRAQTNGAVCTLLSTNFQRSPAVDALASSLKCPGSAPLPGASPATSSSAAGPVVSSTPTSPAVQPSPTPTPTATTAPAPAPASAPAPAPTPAPTPTPTPAPTPTATAPAPTLPNGKLAPARRPVK